MPRKGLVTKREPTPDPKYGSVLSAKFINNLMKKGKKSIAYSIFYKSFDIIKEKTKQDPLGTEVRPSRRQALSIRWIIRYAGERGEKTMAAKLAGELIDASNSKGAAIKKKEDTHRMAEANKAFAHCKTRAWGSLLRTEKLVA
jgi:small subunit ribosomal protein S7